jgi:hypothetical protein
MPRRSDEASEIVDRLAAICLSLPEARQEHAWVGIRWRIKQHTFAHVLTIEGGWPPAYAKAAGSSGPLTVLTFQSSGDELEALSNVGHPYFRPPWRPGIVGRVLADPVDWTEIAELVTESYCLLAPKRLAEQIDRPPPAV